MFKQLLFPVADSIGLSFCVALLPVVAVLLLLGVFRRPAWQASAAGLGVGLVIAVSVWKMPADMALSSVANGAVFALWPVMWIVINALLLYNITVTSGRFDAFRNWIVGNIPNDRRIVLILVGFCFGALLEGIAGFGAPVAITSSTRCWPPSAGRKPSRAGCARRALAACASITISTRWCAMMARSIRPPPSTCATAPRRKPWPAC